MKTNGQSLRLQDTIRTIKGLRNHHIIHQVRLDQFLKYAFVYLQRHYPWNLSMEQKEARFNY